MKIYEGRYGMDVYEEHLNVSGALFRFYLKTLHFTKKCCLKNKWQKSLIVLNQDRLGNLLYSHVTRRGAL